MKKRALIGGVLLAALAGEATAQPSLPKEFAMSAPKVGRYATLIDTTQHWFEAIGNWSDRHSISAMVLSLDDGGIASSCRGQQVVRNSPTGERRSEMQQGYRGHWKRDGKWIDVQLDINKAECAQVSPSDDVTVGPLHLRCTFAAGNAKSRLTADALLCMADGDADKFGTDQLVPNGESAEWMILGSGDGLAVTVSNGVPENWQWTLAIKKPDKRIDASSWRTH